MKTALESTIPEFAKCYEGKTGANKSPIAIMEMVSDPELGTVIDTTQMIDADGNPLPKDIDECLRTTADSLSLPPLDEIAGDRVAQPAPLVLDREVLRLGEAERSGGLGVDVHRAHHRAVSTVADRDYSSGS